MVTLDCFKCERETEIYAGRTKESWLNGYRCPVCGEKDTFWRDVFVDEWFNGCVFTVDDRRVE
jgi:DNA-directed RNA polymerase subunit RPC12/RpoP